MKASMYHQVLFFMAMRPLWAHSVGTRPKGVTRTDLQQHNISIPGHETVQNKVDFEPGSQFPRHFHHGEEIIYVLEGLLEYQLDGEPPKLLGAGDVLFVPAGKVHSVRNVGNCKGSELGTYILESGKPLVTLV